MNTQQLWFSIAGGAAIGVAVSLLILVAGKVAGISGIYAGLMRADHGERYWRLVFLAGLLLPAVYLAGSGNVPRTGGLWVLALAGLLVGVGTRTSGGCTSGHGVCGVANLSVRSLVATLTFVATAMLTVFLVRYGATS